MEIGWIMFGFFIFVTMVFVVIAIFLPEWVGITGKKAQEYIREHSESTNSTITALTPSSDAESKK